MTEISALNEQLLKSIGFGVALFSAETQKRVFANEAFEQWFGGLDTDHTLTDLLQIDGFDPVKTALAATGAYDTEIRFRVKRRMTVVAVSISESVVGTERLLILQAQNITRIRELETMIESYSAMVERNTREIEREKAQVEKLLLNILPKGAYAEYKSVGVVTPSHYEACGVLYLDFIEFYDALKHMAPAPFVAELNELHSAFDRIAEQFGCERIKTTGDTYVVVSGLQDRTIDHTNAICQTALRFVRYLERRNTLGQQTWTCRIGLGVGPVLGSVVGIQRYVYDLFGPAVAHASEACVQAEPMGICAHSSLGSAPNGVTYADAADGFYQVKALDSEGA